jgi:enamine deaminase RidA (YjgF/YER057c/UK114 family)
MSREPINPTSLHGSVQYGYSHAIKSTGGTTIYCAGQVGWDQDRKVVGEGDIGVQARHALGNLKVVLAAAGASVADVVSLRTYVVNHSKDTLKPVGSALAEFFGDVVPPANTWIGVQALALPGLLIEIEAIAVIP